MTKNSTRKRLLDAGYQQFRKDGWGVFTEAQAKKLTKQAHLNGLLAQSYKTIPDDGGDPWWGVMYKKKVK